MGEYLAGLGSPPHLVLCSTARRTRETLDRLLPSFAPPPRILYEEDLYLADAAQLLHRLWRLPENAESVLLIGHNPGLHRLLIEIVRGDEGGAALSAGFPTAALAVLRIAGAWAGLGAGRTTLVDYRTPKSLIRDRDPDRD